MERKGRGYTPRITPLTHERAFIASRSEDEQMTPVDNGGWCVETRSFTPVRNYRQLNRCDYADKHFLFIPLRRLFLDGFTVAVEEAYLDQTSWKSAFRFSDDWLALGTDLVQAETVWLNERHRVAIAATVFYQYPSRADFSTYPALGRYLVEEADWQTSRQRLRVV
jgi:hypothetical protein